MGWISEFEQQALLTLYGKLAQHRCNYCRQPIFIYELFIVDPKGGYFPKKEGMPDFLPARPRKTYHRKCDDLRRGKQPKDYLIINSLAAKLEKEKGTNKKNLNNASAIRERVLLLLERKPKKQYWTRTLIARTLWKKEGLKKLITKKVVREMIEDRLLRKNDIYLTVSTKRRNK